MYRFTTPVHRFKLPVDPADCEVIQITYKQKCSSIIKEYAHGVLPDGMEINENIVTITLSQEETEKLKANEMVQIQVRALLGSGVAEASQKINLTVEDVLTGGVLT